MKIALVVNTQYGQYASQTESFMVKVCLHLGAEYLVFKMKEHNTFYYSGEILKAKVDAVIIQVGDELRDDGVWLAEALLKDGVQCMLIGPESYDRSPLYPLYSLPGPPDERQDQPWYIKEVADDILTGPLTHPGTAQHVMKKVSEASEAVAVAEQKLTEAKELKAAAEKYRDDYLELLLKIWERSKQLAGR